MLQVADILFFFAMVLLVLVIGMLMELEHRLVDRLGVHIVIVLVAVAMFLLVWFRLLA